MYVIHLATKVPRGSYTTMGPLILDTPSTTSTASQELKGMACNLAAMRAAAHVLTALASSLQPVISKGRTTLQYLREATTLPGAVTCALQHNSSNVSQKMEASQIITFSMGNAMTALFQFIKSYKQDQILSKQARRSRDRLPQSLTLSLPLRARSTRLSFSGHSIRGTSQLYHRLRHQHRVIQVRQYKA